MDKLIPGTHIFWVEYRCKCCGKLPPEFYIYNEINPEYMSLFRAFETVRERYENPITVSRGYTCPPHQLHIFLLQVLRKYGELNKETIAKVANDPTMTPFSVHIFGLGLDLKPPKKDIKKVARIALEMTAPKLRVGWKAYLKNVIPHVHIDLGYGISPSYSLNLHENAEW